MAPSRKVQVALCRFTSSQKPVRLKFLGTTIVAPMMQQA